MQPVEGFYTLLPNDCHYYSPLGWINLFMSITFRLDPFFFSEWPRLHFKATDVSKPCPTPPQTTATPGSIMLVLGNLTIRPIGRGLEIFRALRSNSTTLLPCKMFYWGIGWLRLEVFYWQAVFFSQLMMFLLVMSNFLCMFLWMLFNGCLLEFQGTHSFCSLIKGS